VVVVSEDSRHLVATIGVEDLVIVHAADATLICRKEDAQRLRELVERIKSQYGDEYL
jgi:mannose-1-phosphate guanylyltransferase